MGVSKIPLIFFSIALLTIAGIFLFKSMNIKSVPASVIDTKENIEWNINNQKPEVKESLIDKTIKAIYITSWSASKESYIDYVIDLANDSEINGVVIDIKDWSGYVGYNSSLTQVKDYGAKSIRIKDIKSLLERLHNEGIYTIGRITVFQDPVLAKARPDLAIYNAQATSSLWVDNSGLAWIDPASKDCWDYNIAIAKEAVDLGFDEINFDYVRFPSDGDLSLMGFPFWDGKTLKHLVIRDFFKRIREKLPNAKLSVDLFGLSTISYRDFGVGQIIEDAFEYFDYISPMVYPSHYASGTLGYENPAEHPYEIVKYSIDNAIKRLLNFNKSEVKIRPWLQDFSLGAVYDAEMVGLEIRAVYDSTGDNFAGFMLWSSNNVYTKEALDSFYMK